MTIAPDPGPPPRTREAALALLAVGPAAADVIRGRSLVRTNDIHLMLVDGRPLAELAQYDETEDGVRAALREYGKWLITVADFAP